MASVAFEYVSALCFLMVSDVISCYLYHLCMHAYMCVHIYMDVFVYVGACLCVRGGQKLTWGFPQLSSTLVIDVLQIQFSHPS